MKSLFLLLLACERPEAPAASLIRLDDEPAGTRCEAGGVAVSTGRDRDRNDILSDGEITDTRYVCSGIEGLDGLDGRDGEDPMQLTFGDYTRLEDGSNPARLGGVASTDGMLFVDLGTNPTPSHWVLLGPDEENVERFCHDCNLVPVPAGMAWQVEVINSAWANLKVWWVPLEVSAR